MHKTVKSSKDAVSKQSPSMDGDWDKWEGVDPADQDEDGEETEEYGDVQLQLKLRDKPGEVFNVLHKVATASSRSSLRELPVPEENQFNTGGLHSGLIYKLLSLIFSKTDTPGLEHHASRLFKGGLGRFGLRQAKPKLSDQKVILGFVIGGSTLLRSEKREAQAATPGGDGIE